MFDMMTLRSVFAPRETGRSGWQEVSAAMMGVWRVHTTRRSLTDLSDRMLSDIGLTRDTAIAEAARLPWDNRPPFRRRPGSGLWASVSRTVERARTRRLIAGLDQRALDDMGISRSDAEMEANKPFWR